MKEIHLNLNPPDARKRIRDRVAGKLSMLLRAFLAAALQANATKVEFKTSRFRNVHTLHVVFAAEPVAHAEQLFSLDGGEHGHKPVYGLAVLAALSYSDAAVVLSQSGSFRAGIEAARFWAGAPIEPSETIPGLTVVAVTQEQLLEGQDLERELKLLVRGYPLPVAIDGRDLPRPEAQEELRDRETVPTTYGALTPSFENSMHVYANGLPVLSQYMATMDDKPATVLHMSQAAIDWFEVDPLEPMPGNPAQEEARARIDTAFKGAMQEGRYTYLKRLAAVMGWDAFLLEHYDHCRATDNVHLLDQCPMLPAQLLKELRHSPLSPRDSALAPIRVGEEILSRESIERLSRHRPMYGLRELRAPSPEDGEPGNAAAWLLAWRNKGIVMPHLHWFEKTHWIRGLVTDIDDSNETHRITPQGVCKRANYAGKHLDFEVVYCDSYRISCTIAAPSATTIDNKAVPVLEQTPSGEKLVVYYPAKTIGPNVIEMFSFRDEWGEQDDHKLSEELEEFSFFLKETRPLPASVAA